MVEVVLGLPNSCIACQGVVYGLFDFGVIHGESGGRILVVCEGRVVALGRVRTKIGIRMYKKAATLC